MARVVVTGRASADVAEIVVHLTEHAGHHVAARYLNEFDAVFDRLAAFPRIGPTRPALGRSARVVLVDPYVIVYDHVDDTVTVLRILHGRRNITRGLVRETER